MKSCFLSILLVPFLILISSISFSQQGNVWTFGCGSRVDFSTTPPTVGNSLISSYEGCASATDNSGNFLFYTDGISVWDNNNVVITSALMGHWSAAQSGIIVPEPGTTPGSITDRYYIFSIPQLASERARYTIYNTSTHSISNLNTTLPDHTVAQNTTESITVARHCNGIDFWVITHEMGNNRFKAYQITNSGVMSPVISDVGPVVTSGNGNINSACNMKMASSNKRLAFIVRKTSVNLLDFNPANGTISNPVTVATGSGRDYYGVEFSPNSSVLYYTDILTGLYKYNVLTATTLTLSGSATSYSNLYAGLQLAPNGFIYMAKDGDSNMGNINQTSLGRINNPDNFTGSSYTNNGLLLASGTGVKCGLPNIIPYFNIQPLSVSGEDTICAGESVTLTVSGASNYTWTPNSTLSSGTGSSVVANPPITTTYTVVGLDNGCNLTGTKTVVVNPIPVITVNSPTICEGSSVILTANGAAIYTWSPSATLSTNTGNTVTAEPSGIGTATYQVTGNSNGCSASATAEVTINPIPSIMAFNNGPLCTGLTLELTATGQTGATYNWIGPNSFVANSQNPQLIDVDYPNEGIYTVTCTLNGCSNTSSTVFSISSVSGSSISPSGPYCENDSPVILSASVPGGSWSGAGIINSGIGEFDPSLASIGENTVTYTTVDLCAGVTTATIIVNPLPLPSFFASTNIGCFPLNVQFTNTTNPLGTSAFWDFGNGETSTDNSPVTNYFTPGCYTVSLTTTDLNGCVGTTVYDSVVCVSAEVSPIAGFSVESSGEPMVDSLFYFINSSSNAVSYQWDFGDNTQSTSENPDHTYSEEESYLVQLIAYSSSGCSDTAYMSVSIMDYLIYYVPNAFTPNGDGNNDVFIPVFTSGIDPNDFSFMIFDRWGELIFETNDIDFGWDGLWNGKLVQDGVYVWELHFKLQNTAKKMELTGHITKFN